MAVFTGNGSAGSPSFTFSADTDTGFYLENGSIIGVASAGKKIISCQGSVPLNTFSENNDSIHLRSTITTATSNGDRTAKVQFLQPTTSAYHNLEVAFSDLTLRPNGNALAQFRSSGETSIGLVPNLRSRYRDVQTVDGRTPYLQLHGTSAGDAGMALTSWSSSSGGFYSPHLFLARSLSGTKGTIGTRVTDGTELGNVVFSGDNGTDFQIGATIEVEVDGTPTATSIPSEMRLAVCREGLGSPSTRLQLQSNGQVVIGAAGSPSAAAAIPLAHNDGSASGSSVYAYASVPAIATNLYRYYSNLISTVADSFTCSEVVGYNSTCSSLGAGSSITTLTGFKSTSSMTRGTTNYGFLSEVPSGTGRWNFYASGSAPNYFNGSLKLGGTATRSALDGDNQLVLFNGTPPQGTLNNGVSFYSVSGEARVMDSAGNSTLLSPHDRETNEWIYDSVYTPTGKRLRIRMEAMMKALNEHFGWDFIEEV